MKNTVARKIITTAIVSTLFASSSLMAEIASSGTYTIDPTHTTAQFKVGHLGTSHLIGRFNDVSGKIQLAHNGTSSVRVTIRTKSVDTNHKKRDKHLRGPDFFNVRQFPTITFVSSKVTYNTAGEPTQLQGDLTLHGITNVVT